MHISDLCILPLEYCLSSAGPFWSELDNLPALGRSISHIGKSLPFTICCRFTPNSANIFITYSFFVLTIFIFFINHKYCNVPVFHCFIKSGRFMINLAGLNQVSLLLFLVDKFFHIYNTRWWRIPSTQCGSFPHILYRPTSLCSLDCVICLCFSFFRGGGYGEKFMLGFLPSPQKIGNFLIS